MEETPHTFPNNQPLSCLSQLLNLLFLRITDYRKRSSRIWIIFGIGILIVFLAVMFIIVGYSALQKQHIQGSNSTWNIGNNTPSGYLGEQKVNIHHSIGEEVRVGDFLVIVLNITIGPNKNNKDNQYMMVNI
jgi:hypothetical protein